MFGKEPTMVFIGLLMAGAGVFELCRTLFGKNKQFASEKSIIATVALILIGALYSVSAYLDDIGLMGFSIVFPLGIGFASFGISNIILYKTCTHKTTATYLYSQQSKGKGGGKAIPVFRYTFEGEEYTCASNQQVSSSLIGTKYRIDQPCQIFINPNKPKYNIVRFGKMRDEIGKIVIGIGFIGGGVCALLFM